jgi:UDPglucose 6-dehydrogenase
MEKSISVIGLGKLGSPMAACFAAKGLRVIGVDADARKVDAIKQGRAPVFEPRLEQFIGASQGRLSATDSIEDAVSASDITFIVVATPSERGGGFSLRYVLPVCEAIGRALRAKQDFHLVVLTSTVMPGSTNGVVRSTLEQASGKRVSHDFGLCFNPEFIALGSVIRDFLNPDFILIGESDRPSGDTLEAIYKRVCDNEPAVARLNLINAEIAKLAVNTFVTTKISFANMLARMCEKLPDANVDAVTAALGLDTRIGSKYLKGCVSYGGPCFPRDNLALGALARQVGAPADIAEATDRFNRSQIAWLADLVQDFSPQGGNVGILGLTYKPHTDVVEEAVGLLLALELATRGVPVMVYDPAGSTNSLRMLNHGVQFAATAQECIEQTDTVVLATPWPEFCATPREQWARHSPVRTVVDCWHALEQLENYEGVRYVCLGRGRMLADVSSLPDSELLVRR